MRCFDPQCQRISNGNHTQREMQLEMAVWIQAGVAGSCVLVGLFFHQQDGGSTSLRNDCKILPAHAAAPGPVK
jgi:hypothetical protein